MTIQDGMRRAGQQLARLVPHADTVQLPGTAGGVTVNEWGEVLPGTLTSGPSYPCHADRLSAEDATRAGLSAEREVWRVVVNEPVPITPQSTLTLTLSNVETPISLTVTQVSGRLRTVALCQRSG